MKSTALVFVVIFVNSLAFAAEDIDEKFAICVTKAAEKSGTGYTSGDRGRSAALLIYKECREQEAKWVKQCITNTTPNLPERECKLRAGIAAQTALLLNECKLRQVTDARIPC